MAAILELSVIHRHAGPCRAPLRPTASSASRRSRVELERNLHRCRSRVRRKRRRCCRPATRPGRTERGALAPGGKFQAIVEAVTPSSAKKRPYRARRPRAQLGQFVAARWLGARGRFEFRKGAVRTQSTWTAHRPRGQSTCARCHRVSPTRPVAQCDRDAQIARSTRRTRRHQSGFRVRDAIGRWPTVRRLPDASGWPAALPWKSWSPGRERRCAGVRASRRGIVAPG